MVFSTIQTPWLQYFTAIVIVALVSFVGWWVAPRTLGKLHEEGIAIAFAPLMGALSTVLWPISQLLIWIANALTPGPGWSDGPMSAEAQKMEVASEGEREMIRSVFELGDTIVREVMVPRTDVVYLEHDKTLRQGLSLALRSGFSRIPVVGEDIDEVLGILYVKDLMKRVYDNPASEKTETVDQVMRPATFVPDSKPIDALLRDMQLNRYHMVVVVDEFGGTSGICTIEDLVEEIVGEITDEYDAEPDLVQEVEPGWYRISARMPVDDMAEMFGEELDDEDVETVGGLLAKELNKVPIPGAKTVWQGLEIVAERSTARRHQIDTLLVRRAPEDGDQQDEEDHDHE